VRLLEQWALIAGLSPLDQETLTFTSCTALLEYANKHGWVILTPPVDDPSDDEMDEMAAECEEEMAAAEAVAPAARPKLSDEELARRKATPCRTVAAGKECPYGKKCQYNHGIAPAAAPVVAPVVAPAAAAPARPKLTDDELARRKATPCKAVVAGLLCQFGKKCQFNHDEAVCAAARVRARGAGSA